MTKDNGGPAFPKTLIINDGIDSYEQKFQEGMTLRDYFAGEVLIGFISKAYPHIDKIKREIIAKYCYEQADAMIQARKE